MFIEQYYLGCLAHASYIIGSDGIAAVIDPQRDIDIYVELAKDKGVKIEHVIETHLHADFVSGHRELAALTGAKIYYGHKAKVLYDHVPVIDGHEIKCGSVTLRIMETPGHTPEGICILAIDTEQSNDPIAVFTGDTLFIGDVGRPDLLGATMPATELAGMLYESLHDKLLNLPDDVKVYPAHGAGSMCGRNLSNERVSTIGTERKFNYALQPMSKEDFVKMMTTDLPEPPQYFSKDARINREGPGMLDDVLSKLKALKPAQVAQVSKSGHVVLDTRSPDKFAEGHIPGAVNIGLEGNYASWVGTVLAMDVPIALVTEPGDEGEAGTRMARVGYENIAGYLDGGMKAWNNAGLNVATLVQISTGTLRKKLDGREPPLVVDVRTPTEWKKGHLPGAVHVSLNKLSSRYGELPKDRPLAIICHTGYRSSIANSLLERYGFKNLSNVVGGMADWNALNFPVEA